MRWLFASCAAAAVALTLGVARRATACSCDFPLSGVLAPTEGHTVPRNARIWLGHVSSPIENVQLRKLDQDVAIEVERSEIAVGEQLTLTVLSPRELLEPGEYAVEAAHDPGEAPFPQVSFEVSDRIDTTPPDEPSLEHVEPSVNDDDGDSCGTYRGALLAVEAEGIVLALSAEQHAPAVDPPAGEVLSAMPAQGDAALFGFDTPCGYSAWPGGERVELRFGSFDIAGNFSGLSEPETIERPEHASCSVAIGRPRHKGALALIGLLALTLAGRWQRARGRGHPPLPGR